jgi:hypothetical protein
MQGIEVKSFFEISMFTQTNKNLRVKFSGSNLCERSVVIRKYTLRENGILISPDDALRLKMKKLFRMFQKLFLQDDIPLRFLQCSFLQ